MRHLSLILLVAACGQPGGNDSWKRDHKTDYALPVRVLAPRRSKVEDYVETQAALETDRRADIHAEIDGKITTRQCDVGARVGEPMNGESIRHEDPLVLCRIDDRDHKLSAKEAAIRLEESKGKGRELALEVERAARQLEQARVTLRETESVLKRTTAGKEDGTISIEEHDRATFARNLAEKKVSTAESELSKAKVAVELGAIAVQLAEAASERADLNLEKTVVRAPFAGVVTLCMVHEGERVRKGDLLYRIEDPSTLIVYGDLPVRQSTRVKKGNLVRIRSSAVPGATSGRVTLVSPIVDSGSGTVRTKVRVTPAPGYKPGLFVTLRIVVATRDEALVVPKRAVLHDDEEGSYLYVVEGDQAKRLNVATGFSLGSVLEITEGLPPDAQVVVEGQDTLTDGARVEITE